MRPSEVVLNDLGLPAIQYLFHLASADLTTPTFWVQTHHVSLTFVQNGRWDRVSEQKLSTSCGQLYIP